MHYYKFNIADYRKDTGHLSTIEHGIYRQLIDWYYLDEMPIPKETQVVMRRLRLGSDELHLLKNVLADFFNLTDFGYVHNRIQAELNDYQGQFAKNRVNGKLGGRPKKTQVVILNNQNETKVEPKITLTNKPLTNKPITNNQEPLKTIEVINNSEVSNIVGAKIAPKKGTQLNYDWVLPKAWGEWALTERPDFNEEQVRKMAESFKDYWLANANQAKSKKSDWQATWRNWVRNQKHGNVTAFKNGLSIAEQNKINSQRAKERLFGEMERDVTNESARV